MAQTERCAEAYARASRRLILVDYDGTLVASSPSFPTRPGPDLLACLSALTADPCNAVYIVSGRVRANLEEIFGSVANLGLSAEHGMYLRPIGSSAWTVVLSGAVEDLGWKARDAAQGNTAPNALRCRLLGLPEQTHSP